MTRPSKKSIFLNAAEIIESRGLHKGAMIHPSFADRDSAPVCTMGALTIAITGSITGSAKACINKTDWPPMEYVILQEVNCDMCQYLGVSAVCKWNDNPQRTKEDVVAALRGAAEHVRG